MTVFLSLSHRSSCKEVEGRWYRGEQGSPPFLRGHNCWAAGLSWFRQGRNLRTVESFRADLVSRRTAEKGWSRRPAFVALSVALRFKVHPWSVEGSTEIGREIGIYSPYNPHGQLRVACPNDFMKRNRDDAY